MKSEEANARYCLGKLGSDAIVALANKWLAEGTYTNSLGELCAIREPQMSVVGPLFETAMRELGVGSTTRAEAALQLTQCTLRRISTGELEPVKGAEFLYWQVHHEISSDSPDRQYVGDTLGLEEVFCWLREIWDCRDGSMILYHTDLPRDLAEQKFIEHLIEAAQAWEQREHTTRKSRLPHVPLGTKLSTFGMKT